METLRTHGITILLLLAVFTAAALAIFGAKDPEAHACYAPCTVKFHGAMAEDNFGIDYRGHGVGKGDVRVFRVTP